jgi:hypothetical protein
MENKEENPSGPPVEGMEKRFTERRKRPTRMLSRHTFFGRRKGFRRESDKEKGGYVDRYSPKLFLLLFSILILNVVDVLLTATILYQKGARLNPVVRSIMRINGERFWILKFGIVAVLIVLLCLHIKFRPAKAIITVLCSIYLLVILYQFYLLYL